MNHNFIITVLLNTLNTYIHTYIADLVAAGTDTISVTLHWTFAIMCNYPTVQQRVVAEIDQFIEKNGRIPEFTEREEVPYCISVIKECMRYKPTTPFGLPRAVHEDGTNKNITWEACVCTNYSCSRGGWLHHS